VVFIESILFWIGIVLVYLNAQQLRLKYRLMGVLCGLIPVVNIVLLFVILSIARKEIIFESQKLQINEERKDEQICKTKYPILLVHGVFFRDSELLNYWGRIPDELIKNGAEIYYGNQDSSSSVMDSAKTLAMRIKEIVESTGCEKVNIIAHSKGGLDSRAAIATTDAAQYVASLTTVSTPHRGCEFADWLFTKISEEQRNALAKVYNTIAQKAGDKNPDFLAAVSDLTASSCKKFNEQIHDDPNVYYQSVGSVMKHSVGGNFPLNLTYAFVKHFDGPNDGLVGSDSFEWGDKFQLLTVEGNRGISHSDMIDLNRENIPGFDVREFYANLVSELKTKGF
jgi:triacylglycerol lipase